MASHILQDPDSLVAEIDKSTLTQYIQSRANDNDLTILMNTIQLACKAIARCVRKAGIAGLYGLAGEENSSGDQVKKLDIISNDIMVGNLRNSGVCSVLVSEEDEEPVICPHPDAKYCVAFDPLDGSSNIDCNISTGTIFGVYEKKSTGLGKVEDILRSGNDLVAAGYCMYGSATEMVVVFRGHGVHRFTLDPSLGEFIHVQARLKIPDKPKTIYSCNEGNFNQWDDPIKAAVEAFKNDPKPFSARYVGSMVSDLHRTLLYGGVFLYPADKKAAKGKLRLLYEGLPMAMVIEGCGGKASTGMFKGSIQRILDVMPEHIHDRCPIIMGNPEFVDRVLAFYN